MAAFKIEGLIEAIMDERVISPKFRLREFAVKITGEKFPQTVLMQFTNDNIKKLDEVGVGDAVEVSFNIKGREHSGKYYNSLEAWSMRVLGRNSQRPQQIERPSAPMPHSPDNLSDGGDDLPF
jgi:hypothetical protein